MLTPVDVNNKVFKGGIGYDKKDVESFMLEMSTDYGDLYRSNVELKDKVAALNESLQHYRSIEDSMQKAMTLSEKTAEETLDAAHDRARQVVNEAELKAESILADAKEELQQTKDEIYRLQQQHATFKEQFTKILDAQMKMMNGEVIDIDLGADFQPSNSGFGYSEGGLGNEGGLGGGLGAGTYTGADSSGRERTNQEPAFDRGSLNMDPFADAANGGGRFSRQTGGVYTGAKKKGANTKDKASKSESSLNVKNTQSAKSGTKKKATQAKTVAQPTETPVQATANTQSQTVQPSVEPKMAQTNANNGAVDASGNTVQADYNANTVTRDEVLEAISAVQAVMAAEKEKVSGEVESKVDESRMLDSEDNYSEGFEFVAEGEEQEDTYVGEVESKVDESRMLDSEDNYSDGFDFIVDEDTTQEEIPTILNNADTSNFSNEDVLVGDVEDNVRQSNLIGNDDDEEEGFNFL